MQPRRLAHLVRPRRPRRRQDVDRRATRSPRLIQTSPPGEWAAIGPTYGDARDTCIESADSGLLAAFELTDCARFITIDLATSTKTSADFTVAAAWAITLAGDLVLLDRKRDRVPELDHADFSPRCGNAGSARYDVTTSSRDVRHHPRLRARPRRRPGRRARGRRRQADPRAALRRAGPPAPGVAAARRPWLDEWIDEHADFPKSRTTTRSTPAPTPPGSRSPTGCRPRPTSAEAQAATADPEYVDLMTAQW
jgi:hypothetical protein